MGFLDFAGGERKKTERVGKQMGTVDGRNETDQVWGKIDAPALCFSY